MIQVINKLDKKFIFFPIINTECSSLEGSVFPDDIFFCSNKAQCRSCNDKFY
ncbi:MAG: hypothetical protein HC933_20720 [Pleurocapsa sp. SU_196_0]|nr:hypothetical protein [Pleurocapsa sp. SU_196_0]